MSRIFGLTPVNEVNPIINDPLFWGQYWVYQINYQQLHSHLNVAWQIMVFAMERTVKELGAYPPRMARTGWSS